MQAKIDELDVGSYLVQRAIEQSLARCYRRLNEEGRVVREVRFNPAD